MNNLQDLLRQIQKDLRCPVCGESFSIGAIIPQGLFNKTLVVQTTCEQGHRSLFVAHYHKKKVAQSPIETADVLDLHEALKTFDGDFIKLWAV